jgi:UDP-N-acetylglucosamine acyltransferase
MATRIHRTAIIHEDTFFADDVEIGPYCVIGPGVRIGEGTRLGSHVVIECNTRIGATCVIKPHAVIGSDAQDSSYHGEPAYVEIGDRNLIGEFAMISRGSHGEHITRVGDDNMIMCGVHIAHDCQVGSSTIISNYVQFGGHIIVEDRVVIGGTAAFRQFCRIGTLSMVGGTAGVMQDVPPYCMVQGAPPATVRGLNRIGLGRNGVSPESITALKHCYRLMFRRGMSRDNALDEIERLVELTPEVRYFVQFCRAPSKVGICRPVPTHGMDVIGGDKPQPPADPFAEGQGSEQQPGQSTGT